MKQVTTISFMMMRINKMQHNNILFNKREHNLSKNVFAGLTIHIAKLFLFFTALL